MKNLELFRLRRFEFREILSRTTDILPINLNELTIFFVANNIVHKFNSSDAEVQHIAEDHKCITKLTYLVHTRKLWFGTGISFVCYTPETNEIEVFDFPENYADALWSPQQDVLTVITSNDKIFAYTFDFIEKKFTSVGECDIDQEVSLPLTVGWGSKDTQFRGSEGKRSVEKKREVSLKEADDEKPRIVWREDQEYFVINYWKRGRRMFKIFQFPCNPVYAAEDEPGLQASITWKGKTNMIACPVITDKIRINIYEKNALPKQSFDLYDQMTVEDLQWDHTGEILAVQQREGSETFLSLYTTNNNNWYLKQRLVFDIDNQLSSFKWYKFADKIYELIAFTTRDILIYDFIYKVHRSTLKDGKGTCAVIDGNKLLVTHFAETILPPPRAGFTVQLRDTISFLIFYPNEPKLLAIDCHYHCYLYEFKGKEFELIEESDIDIRPTFRRFPFNLYRFMLKDSNTLLAFAKTNIEYDNYIEFEFKPNVPLKPIVAEKLCPRDITYMAYDETVNQYIEIHSGHIITINLNVFTNTGIVIYFDSAVIEGDLFTFWLDHESNFYINQELVLSGATSFLIYDKYLMVTSTNKFYTLRLKKNPLVKICQQRSLLECCSREMEKNGLLITGIPGRFSVVLQMPRGNLEINNSKLMLIDKLESLLVVNKWKESMELINLEKMNSNLLFDINPKRFLEKITDFLYQVESNLVIMFILELVEDNVLETVYKNCHIDNPDCVSNKKKQICTKIVQILEHVDVSVHVRVILVASFTGQGLASAMDYLSNIFSGGQLIEKYQLSLTGLECIKLYFSADEVSRAALETYDMKFASFVYENSTFDPKIYKPMLAEFGAPGSFYERCVKINDYLGNYSVALEFMTRQTARIAQGMITQAGLFPVLEYAIRHNLVADLYALSLKLNLYSKEIASFYAMDLAKKGSFKEAGTIFASVYNWQDALEQFKECNCWQEAVNALKQLSISKPELQSHLTDIAERLARANQYKDASHIYETFLSEVELSVAMLVKGTLFHEAVRVAEISNRLDLVETPIKPETLLYVDNMRNNLDTTCETFTRYVKRLLLVRAGKLETRDTEEEVLSVMQPSYAESVGSRSTATRSTRSSRTTSRRRRKESLKMQDLREGGFYEDIALMRTLHKIITHTFSLNEEVTNLCLVLLKFKDFTRVDSLQNLFIKLQDNMIENLFVIWPPEMNLLDVVLTPELEMMRENIDCLEMQYRYHPHVYDKIWRPVFSK